MWVTFSHLTGVFVALLLSASAAAAQTPPPLPLSENGTQFVVFFRSQPIGRLVTPQEVARVVGLLVADSGAITGQGINVDGGTVQS